MTKPLVVILGTGGTIAGNYDQDSNRYVAGKLPIEQLVRYVPELREIALIEYYDLMNIDSRDMNKKLWLQIAQAAEHHLKRAAVSGVVITHGTDTLEETAYFLQLVLATNKPVVLTGAMRPADALGSDGPLNLFNAVCLAASAKANRQGVLVAFNEQIFSATNLYKSHSNFCTAFSCQWGPLGQILGGQAYFYHQLSQRHTCETEFSLADISELPKVAVIYSWAGINQGIALVQNIEGLIYVGVGGGSVSNTSFESLIALADKAIPIVITSRAGQGLVIPQWVDKNFIAGMGHTPEQARILLMLCLNKKMSLVKIQETFLAY